MRWLLVVVVVLTAVALFVATRTDAPPDQQLPAGGAAPDAEGGAGEAAPMLTVREAERPHADAGDAVHPATRPGAEGKPHDAPGAAPVVEPGTAPVGQGEGERKASPPTRKLRPGETFTPITALELPTKEEREAAARKTREILENLKPARATWSDAPLQDVLRHLSKETGLVLALGPRALRRGMKVRVSDPLGGADPAIDPTAWNILEALAEKNGFVLSPWKRGVVLREVPDPEEMQTRIYALQDLVLADWGNREGIDAEDRLAAVFVELVRVATALPTDSKTRMIGSNLVVRQTRAAHERIGKALDVWRAEPDRFQQAYKTLIANRHPTVSGAPPRTGSKDEAGSAGK